MKKEISSVFLTLLVLIRIYCPEDKSTEDDEESLLMGLFLEFLMQSLGGFTVAGCCTQPENLVSYSEEMSQELDNLLAEVKTV